MPRHPLKGGATAVLLIPPLCSSSSISIVATIPRPTGRPGLFGRSPSLDIFATSHSGHRQSLVEQLELYWSRRSNLLLVLGERKSEVDQIGLHYGERMSRSRNALLRNMYRLWVCCFASSVIVV